MSNRRSKCCARPARPTRPPRRWRTRTAYFGTSEALTNIARYAGATRATVRVTRPRGHVVVEVADDGVGGADPARGTGLRGLRDRVEALGGGLRVAGGPTGGTVVTARLPVSP